MNFTTKLPQMSDKALNEIRSRNEQRITELLSEIKSDLHNERSSLSKNLRMHSQRGKYQYFYGYLGFSYDKVYDSQYLCTNLAKKLNQEFVNYFRFTCHNGNLTIQWPSSV